MENQKAIAVGEAMNEKDVNIHDRKLEIKVVKFLDELGIPITWDGYEYLITAILLCVEDNSYIGDICYKLYPEVARIHGIKNPFCIERSIRYAISTSWKNANQEWLREFFSYTIDYKKENPTNTEFISMVAERFRLQSDGVSEIERKVSDILFEFGISPRLNGYYYLKSAILMQLPMNKFKKIAIGNLYLDVGKLYNKNWHEIERCIRTAVSVSWEHANVKIINDFFSETLEYKANPNNSTFIKTVLQKLRYQLY